MPIQWGALSALGEQASVDRMRETYRRRRDLALSILRPAGLADYTPEGAFYILADVSPTGLTGDEFAQELLREERVAVAPGAGFALLPTVGPDNLPVGTMTPAGAPDYPTNPKARHRVRIAFCVSDEQLREGLTRLVRFAEKRRAA